MSAKGLALSGLGARSLAQPLPPQSTQRNCLGYLDSQWLRLCFGSPSTQGLIASLGPCQGVSPVCTHCQPQNLLGILRPWAPCTNARRTLSSQSPGTLKQPRTPTRPQRSLWSPVPLALPTVWRWRQGPRRAAPLEKATHPGGLDSSLSPSRSCKSSGGAGTVRFWNSAWGLASAGGSWGARSLHPYIPGTCPLALTQGP